MVIENYLTDIRGAFSPIQMQMNLANHSVLYNELKPSPNLQKYIYSYWVGPSLNEHSINNNKIPKDEIVVPDGCIDLLLGTDKDGAS